MRVKVILRGNTPPREIHDAGVLSGWFVAPCLAIDDNNRHPLQPNTAPVTNTLTRTFKNQSKPKALVLGLIVLAFSMATIAAVPTATAHKCADHYTCPSDGCVNGEYHDHTDYNSHPMEDGHCESQDKDGDGSCYYPDSSTHLPPVICELLGYDDDGSCTAGELELQSRSARGPISVCQILP